MSNIVMSHSYLGFEMSSGTSYLRFKLSRYTVVEVIVLWKIVPNVTKPCKVM